MKTLLPFLLVLAPLQEDIAVPTETYTLPNGLTVTLHPDPSLPKVVINTWFAVGSKDEEPGRTGFAHLFEHLMFMGTERVPGNQFDVLMEQGGGSNNASTSTDRTNYYSMGPSALLPTLLWLDADRLDALPESMTQEKLDRQRDVVRNERRQNTENVPYGRGRLLLSEALYPEGHPYHHPVIGSHEDLEAATLEDVIDFFRTYYVPANASLVVAGAFDPAEVKPLIARTFGAVPARPAPQRRAVPPVRLEGERRVVTTDDVEFPKLTLAWHSPPFHRPGDAAMDLVGAILSDGPSSRLVRRLVQELELAQDVAAYQASAELGSSFRVEAVAAPGADLEAIRHVVLDELERLAQEGPTEEELARAKAAREASFLSGMESLLARADSINEYRHYYGVADGFQRDLDRWLEAGAEDVTRWAREVFGGGFVDLRILPEGETVPGATLAERPEDFPPADFSPPVAETLALSSGVPVHVIPRPGTRLISGALVARGGGALVEPERAGLAELAAALMDAGAGGLDRVAFAQAVDSIGASIATRVDDEATTVAVSGLTSHLAETLDRFADVVLRPNLAAEDFALEKSLALAALRARADDPNAVARLVLSLLLYGREDPRGRPDAGFLETARELTLEEVRALVPRLVTPESAAFVFVGDFEPAALVAALEERFGSWSGPSVAVAEPPLVTEPAAGRIVLVDRPGAPQTVIRIGRPAEPLEGLPRRARAAVDTVFGGTFTSRLNGNLREDKGYTYGAGSAVLEDPQGALLVASSAVRTDVTGAALTEFRREFERMAEAGLAPEELAKATETLRREVVETAETTRGLARTLSALVHEDRPLDDLARTLDALDALDLEDANAIARSGLYAWEDLLVVLVGDAEAVLPQLEAAGFPAPERVDPEGRPLAD